MLWPRPEEYETWQEYAAALHTQLQELSEGGGDFAGEPWNHLQGVTSPIQTQLDAKLASASYGVPLVSAYRSGALAGNFTTATELVLDGEVFDPSGIHSTSTGRTTPLAAGKYAVLAGFFAVNWTLTVSLNNSYTIRKNSAVSPAGSYVEGTLSHGLLGAAFGGGLACGQFDMNGTTDYLSTFLQVSTDTSIIISNFAYRTYMHVFRVSD